MDWPSVSTPHTSRSITWSWRLTSSRRLRTAHLTTVRGRNATRTRKAVTIVHHHHLATMRARKLDQRSGKLPARDDLDSAEKRALAGRFSDGFNPELAFGQNNRSWSMDGIQLAREESTASLPPIFSKIHKQSTLFPVTKPRKKVNKRKQGNFVRIRRPESRDTAPSEPDSSLFLGIISQQSRPSLA